LVWARAPRLFLSVAALYGAIDRRSSPIELALCSLLTVRISQLNGCSFRVDINSATLLRRGVSEDKALALADWRSSTLFAPREAAALACAEAVTRQSDRIDGAVFEDLSRHFDDDALVELTGLIAFQNLSSKFNSALGVPPQGFCTLPEPAGRASEVGQ
jgi:AhpD family alkylhydroperoxidase